MKVVDDVLLNKCIQKIRDLFSLKGHTHNYAGSNISGGSATHAVDATRADSADSAAYAAEAGHAETADSAITLDQVLGVNKGGTGVTDLRDLVGFTEGRFGFGNCIGACRSYTGDGNRSLRINIPSNMTPLFVTIMQSNGGVPLAIPVGLGGFVIKTFHNLGIPVNESGGCYIRVRIDGTHEIDGAHYIATHITAYDGDSTNVHDTRLIQLFNELDTEYNCFCIAVDSPLSKFGAFPMEITSENLD